MNTNIWLVDDDQAAHVYHKVMIEDAGLDVTKVQSFFSVDQAISRISTLNDQDDFSQWPSFIIPYKTTSFGGGHVLLALHESQSNESI